MNSSNKVTDFSKAKALRNGNDSFSNNEFVKLGIKKHDSFSDLIRFNSELNPNDTIGLIKILEADSLTTKNLSVFFYLCAINDEIAKADFIKLNLQEFGVVYGELFQEIAHSLDGSKKLEQTKIRISDFKGEIQTLELKNIKALLNSFEIGSSFKQESLKKFDRFS